jgi:poly(A) polymerase
MIKKLISKLFGKTAPSSAALKPPLFQPGQRVEVPKSEHRIDPDLVEERAVKVVATLVEGGFEAYIVGGAVRDLLVGLRPKDFDVATNATPEQVKGLFRRAFIIGRRFRIVHVVFGRGRQDRGLSEVIEVSTFRAMVDPAAADQITGNEKTAKRELEGRLSNSAHVVDIDGRVLRDNVWGLQVDDAARRDFTINAMYYDPLREIVVDYHGGIHDVKQKLLRMIGDPALRFREDPVRIIRVVRFAAKLGFEIEAKTRAPIREMAALLDNVPASRTFDEMIKLLQTGHALASIDELRKQGLNHGVFPVLDVALNETHLHPDAEKFVKLCLADTDRRVVDGKPVAPSFMLACMLWHEVLLGWNQRKTAGESPLAALQDAVEVVFDARIGDISGRGRLAGDMREIWLMQPRFDRRQGASVYTLVEQPRFRAAYDFLKLRGEVGEVDPALAQWWEDFSLADDVARLDLLEAVRPAKAAPRRVRNKQPAAAPSELEFESKTDAVAVTPELIQTMLDNEPADPTRRRRRRRRKPGAPIESGESYQAARGEAGSVSCSPLTNASARRGESNVGRPSGEGRSDDTIDPADTPVFNPSRDA